MDGEPTAAQREWVRRVLGVGATAGDTPFEGETADEAPLVGFGLYQLPYAVTASAQAREAIDRIVSGAAASAFQASQQAPTIAS